MKSCQPLVTLRTADPNSAVRKNPNNTSLALFVALPPALSVALCVSLPPASVSLRSPLSPLQTNTLHVGDPPSPPLLAVDEGVAFRARHTEHAP